MVKRMSSFNKSKQASPAKLQADVSPVGAVSPSVIGNRVLSDAHRPHLLCEEDDARWPHVEDLDAVPEKVSWRRCKGCSFSCATNEPVCIVCGTHNPLQSPDHCIINIDKVEAAAEAQLLDEEASSSLSTEAPPTENSSNSHGLPSDGSDGESAETDDEFSDDDDGELVPGTLDFPPAVGTRVKVLYDDDQWHLAEVLKVSGTKAQLSFQDGKQAVLDFEVHAVRFPDYESEDEEEDEEDDEDAPPPKVLAREDDSDSEWEEEQIPGTLDEAPPVGSMVKVLGEDDTWHPARVSSVEGTVARLTFEDGDVQEVDFDEHAVRLNDYVSEDEEDEVF